MENHSVDLPQQNTTSRRRLLSSLLAGGAFAVAAPVLATRVSAEGTTAPNRDARDNAALNALLDREAQMVATYAGVVGSLKDADDIAAFTLIHDHHVAYEQAIKGYLARAAVAGNRTPLASPSGSLPAIAGQLASLEEATMNQHIAALGNLIGLDGAKLVASIITTEARHIGALSIVSGAAPLTAAGN